MRLRATLFIFLSLLCVTAAPVLQAKESPLPKPAGFINDFAGIVSGEDRQRLEALAIEIEKKTTCEVTLVTIDSTKPYPIEDYAVRLFKEWGIGKKGKDNGVLLLIAKDDRKMKIEVGYGLEGAIPDALAKKIIAQYITPHFKEGNYSKGVLVGMAAIAGLIAKEYNVGLTGGVPAVPLPQEETTAQKIFGLIFTVIFILLFLSLRMGFFWLFFMPGTYRRRGGFWHGGGYGGNSGGFSGGFGGFGGGLSGGGGASGGW